MSGRALTAIIGAGPAGLTAAYELGRAGAESIVLEADNIVGGIARTACYKGYLFDIGGHRFYTRVSLIDSLWSEVLGADMLTRPRSSRIYYRSRFFQYPLEPLDALAGLGPIEALRCAASYLRARLHPRRPEPDFETWVSNRFGSRLFRIFFKTYTEKVWGIPCNEIRAEWAAQRIKDLSLRTLIQEALGSQRRRRERSADPGKAIRTLIHEFKYPRRGPGMMWERMRERVEAMGSRVLLNHAVEKIHWRRGQGVTGLEAGGGRRFEVENLVSSMPIRDLFSALIPAPPAAVLNAVAGLNYRDFLTVALILRDRDVFQDNWIYVHEPSVKVGRIQNYKSWSPEMVPDPANTCVGLEYFCFEGDGLWASSDEALVERAARELCQLGLARREDVLDGTVVRMKKAYPVYDDSYEPALQAAREFVAAHLPNLQLVGRNGMHRYNNQDHSMLTAMLAARNILGGNYDLWRVNADADYLEEGGEISAADLGALARSQPAVPGRLTAG